MWGVTGFSELTGPDAATAASAGSSSPLMPTPSARDFKGAYPRGDIRSDTGQPASPSHLGLVAVVTRFLPTPTTAGRGSGGMDTRDRREGKQLPAEVSRLFRTPGANLGSNGGAQPAAKRLAGGHHPSIEDQVAGLALLPTPLTGEARHGSPNQHRSRGDTMLTGEILRLLAGRNLGQSPTRAAKLGQRSTGRSTAPPSPGGSGSSA